MLSVVMPNVIIPSVVAPPNVREESLRLHIERHQKCGRQTEASGQTNKTFFSPSSMTICRNKLDRLSLKIMLNKTASNLHLM